MSNYLSEYDPAWPGSFLQIAERLHPLLNSCLRIEHVGSTSIPGMVAKPIIDIDIVLIDGGTTAATQSIIEAGYTWQGDLGIRGREAFAPVSEATLNLPSHHVYACEESSPELLKHISFRDFLIAHPTEASKLADLKRHLTFTLNLTRNEYISAKSPMVTALSEAALEWYRTSH